VKLEVSDPFNAGSNLALDVTRPDLTALYLADLPAGTSRTATIQFVWLIDGLTGTLQPVLRRHICWGFQDLDGVEAAEREPARARKHHQPLPKAVPADSPEPAILAVNPAIEAAVQTTVLTTGTGAVLPKEPRTVPAKRTARK
jgi:hypothetical protein